MPTFSPQQIALSGGVNAWAAPHLVGEDQVQTATNIDFSLEDGAASVRLGSTKSRTVGSGRIQSIYRLYGPAHLTSSPMYVQSGTTVYRVVGTASTSIMTNANTDRGIAMSYRDHFYTVAVAGSLSIRDDGTSATHWIKQSPDSIAYVVDAGPTLAVATAFGAGEGTLSTQASGTATFTDSTEPYRIQINGTLLTTNLATNAGVAIGDYGFDRTDLWFDDPSVVERISKDYSIGDTSFTSYYHTELDPHLAEPLQPEISRLIDRQFTEGTSTEVWVDLKKRQSMLSESGRGARDSRTRISRASQSFNPWIVQRPSFEAVQVDNYEDGWDDIQACRIVIEASAPVQVKVRNWQIIGNNGYPLFDTDIGYAWRETYAEIDSDGRIVGEGAPGPSTQRTKVFGSRLRVTGGNTPVDAHGCTHRILYRQGGFLADWYAVATNTIATETYTDSVSDVAALSVGKRLPASTIERDDFYNNIVVAAEPHYDRMFVGFENKIAWSDPGLPDRFRPTSFAKVSHTGDEVYGLVTWPPGLVIVNADSIFELDGNVFEEDEANFVLRRTGAKHGSHASRTCFATPYGIPLVETDGFYMYVPGQGVDAPVPFVTRDIGDAWRGTGTTDPAALKGNRVPAINKAAIRDSCAEYHDGKYWLAMATGTATLPNTVFVVDFHRQRCWWYQYPFEITALYWDQADQALLAGTPNATIHVLNTSHADQTTAGSNSNITWSLRTRAWTAPNDAVLENIMVEYRGQGGSATAIYDGTTTVSVGTLTNTAKDWVISSLGGYTRNNVVFGFAGTQTASSPTALYGIRFDALVEPPRVNFWRTEHETAGYDGEKQWDVAYFDIEPISTGTVTATVFVDATAVMTATLVSTETVADRSRRQVFVQSFPAETYGYVAFVEYTGGAGQTFKHWRSYFGARPEPPRVATFVSTKTCGDEAEWKTFEPCINAAGGVVTATSILDGTAVATNTLAQNRKQSYAFSLPNDLFGRTMYTVYNAVSATLPFKFYEERYESIPEPDVVTNWKHGPVPFDSASNLRTWIAEVNPRNLSLVGTLFADNTAISTATFTGGDRRKYPVGIDVNTSYALQTASILEVYYSGSGFKHWNTQFEVTPKPFGKTTWSVVYRKVGGATQLDMARWWSFDIEVEGTGTATLTSIWDIDGTATNTETFTVTGREWRDRIPWPAGARGQLFQQRLRSSANVRVHAASLDLERVGIKGFSRVSYQGVPDATQ